MALRGHAEVDRSALQASIAHRGIADRAVIEGWPRPRSALPSSGTRTSAAHYADGNRSEPDSCALSSVGYIGCVHDECW